MLEKKDRTWVMIRLDPKMKAILLEYAHLKKITVTQVVRESIAAHLADILLALKQERDLLDAEFKRQDVELAEIERRHAVLEARHGKPEQSPAST
jgi:hypothetical protein